VGAQIPVFGLRRLAKYAGHAPDFTSLDQAKEYFKKTHAEFGIRHEEQWDSFTRHSIEQRAPNLFMVKLDPGIKNPKSTLQMASEFFHHPHKSLEGIIYDIDLWSIWQKIQCPVLVIHGAHSDILTPEIIRKMQRIHTNTQVYEITDAGHAPALFEPEQHQTILAWLDSSAEE
jgi:pimeloyl-ACP methyl ester carboxylesterase